MRASALLLTLLSALAVPTTTWAGEPLAPCAACPITMHPRELLVTELSVLQGNTDLSLRRVLARLASQSGDPTASADTLYRRLWTDDAPSLDTLVPIAAVNRFDLAPHNGRDCGEARLIYGFRPITGGPPEVTVAIDAVIANPSPACGLAACAAIQRAWAGIPAAVSANEEARLLEQLYFQGVAGFPPAISLAGFVPDSSQARRGRIDVGRRRHTTWSWREFEASRSCQNTGCTFAWVPTTPVGALEPSYFDPTNTSPVAAAFRSYFVSQRPRLEASDTRCLSFGSFDRRYATTTIRASLLEPSYVAYFAKQGRSPFSDALAASSVPRTITPQQLVLRAEALSCQGCHSHSSSADLGGGLYWPNALDGTHIGMDTEPGVHGPRYVVSEAVRELFLPERARILREFFADLDPTMDCPGVSIPPPPGCRLVIEAAAPLTGRRPH